ncbi:hypothetical protein T484DRAFT_1809068 [Baffinella frigidus]|nr:hypothetical protein T484DRAFT_1809068 [Cryptophyta sp. CCMP2293]
MPLLARRALLLLAAVLALSAVPTVRAEREIFTWDCAGQMHFFAKTPMAFSMAMDKGNMWINHLYKKLKERASCACPGMTDDEFARTRMVP